MNSAMKGWVYVISNKSMPGLLKIGYSSKDPELRAAELKHTGVPHPYIVEYDMLIENPYEIEQESHKLLLANREGKEFFRCTLEEAIVAIRRAGGRSAILETNRRANREKIELLEAERFTIDREARRKAEIQEELNAEEQAIREKFLIRTRSEFPAQPFWPCWLAGFILVMLGISVFFPKIQDAGLVILSAGIGAGVGTFIQGKLEKWQMLSKAYQALVQERDFEIAAVRSRIGLCFNCGKSLRFDRLRIKLAGKKGEWSCPICKSDVKFPEARSSSFKLSK